MGVGVSVGAGVGVSLGVAVALGDGVGVGVMVGVGVGVGVGDSIGVGVGVGVGPWLAGSNSRLAVIHRPDSLASSVNVSVLQLESALLESLIVSGPGGQRLTDFPFYVLFH